MSMVYVYVHLKVTVDPPRVVAVGAIRVNRMVSDIATNVRRACA